MAKKKQRPVILPRKIIRKPMPPQSPVGMGNSTCPGNPEMPGKREAKKF